MTHNLWFMMVKEYKGYKAKSAKGKGAWGEAWRKPDSSFQESSPTGVSPDTRNSPRSELWQYVWTVFYQGSPLKTQCPGFLLGVGHRGTLCLERIKIPDSQMLGWCSATAYCLHKMFRHSEPFLLKSKFPDASQGPALQADLSKDNHLRPAMLTLFCTPNLGSDIHEFFCILFFRSELLAPIHRQGEEISCGCE